MRRGIYFGEFAGMIKAEDGEGADAKEIRVRLCGREPAAAARPGERAAVAGV